LKDRFSGWDKDRPAPHNRDPYPGDTDGDPSRESYEIADLENGRTYFVLVRTVGPGGAESGPSNEVQFVPISRGTFLISSDHSADNGGFAFDSGLSVSARDVRCDIYLYAKEDEIGLSSPSRLAAGLRQTWFGKPGIVYFKEMDTIRIQQGDRITTSNKYGSSELFIKEINRSGSLVEATIEYVFYPAPPKAGE